MFITEDSHFYHVFKSKDHIFNSIEFQLLNKDKVNSLATLVFDNGGKPKIALIGGVKKGILKSPFSAPFGGFSLLRPSVRLSDIQAAIDNLFVWCKDNGIKEIHITLPPSIYGDAAIDKQLNSLFIKGFSVCYVDLNYSFSLSDFDNNYTQKIRSNARKNLKRALLTEGYNFKHVVSLEEKKKAYNVIAKNRFSRGYPLRLSWEDIQKTSKVINIDFFLVQLHENSVAAAIVFYVTKEIVQVVYWGDIVDYHIYRPMNYLSYNLFKYYKNKVSVIDIGPSTEKGIPNHGLCEFKEGIGCSISSKYTLIKKI
ncbi:hypothetical protein [Aureispira sp. CCB-E]|uniref:hypothetical protein n=1 Tax=Aureispira sp. CCB-E TaxID=3051121 RepID=UPI0028695ED1|nr:hypothetical protein [Aureispira sp. CCB-E]WMX15213.1 hypothetical protein QP953_02365 [Aureispira sp. CCB-E]